ncbi:MAG TPA: hypothetical protein ENI99_00460 [Sedimenticola sp.]|nr:hypothetical protein [Sedimenticola sp.]
MKISQMLIEYASDYIGMASTIEQKQSHLNAACSAWNISILPKHQRRNALNEYIKSYKRYNPNQNDVSHVKHDMELLIKRKLKMFPEIKKPIVNAEIREKDGKYSIFAASIRNE